MAEEKHSGRRKPRRPWADTDRSHTPEANAKRSESLRRHYQTDEGRASLGKVWTGRKHTPESRAKMAESQRRSFAADPTRGERGAAKRRGRKEAPEVTEKRMAKLRGRKRPAEVVARAAAANNARIGRVYAPGQPTIKELWAAAKAAGVPTFDPCVPCVRAHISERWTQSGICILCKRENDNAYNARNTEAHRARSRASADARRDEVREYGRRYQKENPEVFAAAGARRRALKKGAAVGDRTAYKAYMKWAKQAPRVACYWCKAPTKPKARHVDHIIPLKRGGPDAVENLCIACPTCNLRKSAKLPEEFAGQAELRFA